jgi:hypothetical protein
MHGDIQPGEPDRLAGGGEPVLAGQPAGQCQPGDRAGPIQPRRQHPRAGEMAGGLQQLAAQHVHAGFDGGEHVQGGGDLQLPGWRQMGGRGRAQLGQALLGAQRVFAQPGRPGGRTRRGCAAPRRCARPAGRGRSPAASGTPGCVRAGSSIRAAFPRPAASAGAGRRSCRSWRAVSSRAVPRCRPAQRDARRSRRRPAPRRHTATRRIPPPRTRYRHGRRTGPASRAGAPGRLARHGHGHLALHLPLGWHREHDWMSLFQAGCGPPRMRGLTSPDPVTPAPHGRQPPRNQPPQGNPGQAAQAVSGSTATPAQSTRFPRLPPLPEK